MYNSSYFNPFSDIPEIPSPKEENETEEEYANRLLKEGFLKCVILIIIFILLFLVLRVIYILDK